MTSLRQRDYRLVIQDLELFGLDFEFSVKRSLSADQNTAEIVVYNLNADHRKHLATVPDGVVVKLQAGYLGPAPTRPSVSAGAPDAPADLPTIFLGRIREVTHLRAGPDWETHIGTGDGDGKDKPIHFSLGPGASVEAAIRKVVGEMGIGIGNALQAINSAGFGAGLGKVFSGGVTVSGRGDKELERLLNSAGLEFSVQNGELQVLEKGKALNTPAIELTPANGLVGSPELGEKGTVKFRCFLSADVYPGRQVRLRTSQVDAYFRVETASYTGQWAGNDWYTDAECTPVK